MTFAQPRVQMDIYIKRLLQHRLWAFVGTVVFAVLLSGYMWRSYEKAARLSYLDLFIQSSVASNAQIFYDTGKGLSEDESQTRFLQAGTTFQAMRFPLPNKPIILLRFDPLGGGRGRVVLRSAALVNYNGSVKRVLPLESLRAANDIASMQLTREELVIETIPNAKDPQTIFDLEYPIVPPRPSRIRTVVIAVAWFFGAVIFCSALILAAHKLLGSPSLRLRLTEIDSRLNLAARQMSNADFIVFDSSAIKFYASCVVVFVLMSIAGLHGSSIDIFSSVYHRGAPGVEPIVGVPRAIRVDEWNFHTPFILNQYLRPDRYSPKDTLAGPGNAGLIANVPVRHFTTAFRPEFWGFFLLPLDYAYSVYWQAKWFILITGLFTVLLLITHSSIASAIGTLWFLFSAATQWDLSWPSLLPDLVGLSCWIICLFCFLLVSRSLKWACIAEGV